MKNRSILALAAVAAFWLVAGAASGAYAHPTYAQACSGCHGSSTAVRITAWQTANTGTSATYRISITGGSGQAGWAVLEGGVNRTHAGNALSSFTVPVGHTYEVWGVKTSTGANRISLTPPAGTPPTPTPTPTGTITISRSASSVYLPRPFVLSGILGGGIVGDPVAVYVKKPGSARWSYSSLRLVYDASSAWWYRYTPKLRGTYQFQARFAGDAVKPAAVSALTSVAVR